MSDGVMLTTIDNPFNPFTEWADWYRFDTDMGYNTCGLLDRVALDVTELGHHTEQMILNEAVASISDDDMLPQWVAAVNPENDNQTEP